MRVLTLTASPFLLFALVVGCDDPFVGAENDTTAEVGGLLLRLSAPDTVAVADSFEVRVIAQNQSDDDVAVKTPNSCFVIPHVTDGTGDRVPLKGTGILCAAAITTHEIPEGGGIEKSFDVKAVRYTSEGEDPVSPGRFTLQARLDWTIDGEKVDLSVVGRELVIRR